MPKKSATKSRKSSSYAKGKASGGHAYWSGQIKIALIYMPVHIFNATQRSSAIDLHLVDRRSGERIHYANVLENGKAVDDDDIVRAYETDHGSAYLEKDELHDMKFLSSDIFELTEFVDVDAIPVSLFDKPLYVLPTGKDSEEIYITLRDALLAKGKVGIGQLTVRGREELCALMPVGDGLVIELLRYTSELRSPKQFFSDLPQNKDKAANVKMAEELIDQLSTPLKLDQYEDHYHEALMELISSKQAKRKPHYETAKDKPKNVINLMHALRKSLKSETTATKKIVHKPACKVS